MVTAKSLIMELFNYDSVLYERLLTKNFLAGHSPHLKILSYSLKTVLLREYHT